MYDVVTIKNKTAYMLLFIYRSSRACTNEFLLWWFYELWIDNATYYKLWDRKNQVNENERSLLVCGYVFYSKWVDDRYPIVKYFFLRWIACLSTTTTDDFIKTDRRKRTRIIACLLTANKPNNTHKNLSKKRFNSTKD